VIEVIGRTLRLVFGPRQSPSDPDSEGVGPPLPERGPEIEFSAYTEENRLFGRLRLDGERLTDMLNVLDELVLVDVMVESLAGEGAVELGSMAIARDELIAIEASGPRGNPGRRLRVRPFPVGAKLGPYLVRGYVHVTPGADPLLAIRRRRPIIPLTEATIEYRHGATRVQRRSSTILFNRELADWIATSADEAIEFPDLPISGDQGPLTKDFTGQILLDSWREPG
jgi:hypothetical protein